MAERRGRWRTASGLSLLSPGVAVLVSAVMLAGWLERAELMTVDVRTLLLPGGHPAPLAVVAIDGDSIKRTGTWPWPRSLYGRVIREAARDGARAILLDLDLSTPASDPAEDLALTEAIRDSGIVVLAAHSQETVSPEGFRIQNLGLPLPAFAEAAAGIGGIVFTVDEDDTVRRAPAVGTFGDRLHPPLGMVGARYLDPTVPSQAPEGALIRMSPHDLNSIPRISFYRVLDGEAEEGFFRERVVLVGATTQELRDIWKTSVGIVPGVYIHAAVVQSALNRSWLNRPERGWSIFLVAAASLTIGWALARLGWRTGLLVQAGYLGTVILAGWLLLSGGIILEIVPLLLVGMIQLPVRLAVSTRGAERALGLERRKAEAILKLGELEEAERTGRPPYVVPLVLLRQVLDLDQVVLFRAAGDGSGWSREEAAGEGRVGANEDLLREAMDRNDVIGVRDVEGWSLYIPLRTVRRPAGVLYVSRERGRPGEEDLRVLLSFATQTGYFLEADDLNRQVRDLYLNTIKAISKALDSRDHYTGAHAEKSAEYLRRFGRACGLNEEQIEAVHIGALLHDIGKIAVPDRILLKEGRLTEEEFEIMRSHPESGYAIIEDLPLPEDVKTIVRSHHERFDGSGYPDGLRGGDIPLVVRVFSIVDVFEALVSERPYKKPLDLPAARGELERCAGTHFDPELVRIFLSVI
ncbi:MAG: CHASE2 domain-containing protein [bacterium]|nr:MAG: CHASE2 domain-containing protein [bacterium]